MATSYMDAKDDFYQYPNNSIYLSLFIGFKTIVILPLYNSHFHK